MLIDKPTPPESAVKKPSSPSRKKLPSSDDRIRLLLVYMLVLLIPCLALCALVVPTAGPVLDKLLPLLTLVLGYFFSSQTWRVRR